MPSLTASTMSSLLRLTFFSTATTGLILQYAASCSQAASSSAASSAVSALKTALRSSLSSQVLKRWFPAFLLAFLSSSSFFFCASVRSSGFFTSAYLLFLMAVAFADRSLYSFVAGPSPFFGLAAAAADFAACHSSRLTSSKASFIQLTTWNGSMTHLAFGHLRFTSDFIHRAPSAVTTSIDLLCSRVSSSRNRLSTSLP